MGNLKISMQVLERPCSNPRSKTWMQCPFLQFSHTCLPDTFSFTFPIFPTPIQISGVFEPQTARL